MKRIVIWLCVAALLTGCAALAESEGWALASREVTLFEKPEAGAAAVAKVPAGSEMEYLGKTAYDKEGGAWYRVSYKDAEGWASEKDVALKWATLY